MSDGRRLGILISGRGSNFQAIADHIAAGQLDASIAVVISNRADAAGLQIARERRIPALFLPSKAIAREDYDRQVAAELKACQVDLVCLAGFMRLLSPILIHEFPMKILNIHPSLLPSFPGLDAQEQALLYGVQVTGCTVHFVDENLDAGSIIRQAAVPVLPTDTVESLSARILKEEHRLYTEAIRWVLSKKYQIEGRRVIPC
jgi:phosphoribosylglycinamide formyltransferase-1